LAERLFYEPNMSDGPFFVTESPKHDRAVR